MGSTGTLKHRWLLLTGQIGFEILSSGNFTGTGMCSRAAAGRCEWPLPALLPRCLAFLSLPVRLECCVGSALAAL